MTAVPDRPLFRAFPALGEQIPFLSLANLPTPLERMQHVSAETGADIWIKRDGLTHPRYGGNKIRKFEFIFGDVMRKRARTVLTGGGLGSHHTLATAVVAQERNLHTVCSYYCQPISAEVRENLRRSPPLGIEAHFCGDYVGLALSFVAQYARHLLADRRLPYFIYPGAPGTLGALGYVNAAFEIKDQFDAVGEAYPDVIMVATGSCSTCAGLILGARLAGLQSRIVGVRVIEKDVANRPKIARIANRAARFLHQKTASIPHAHWEAQEIELLEGYLGPGYAHPSPEAEHAVELALRLEGLTLETTYTGKAMAALLDYAATHPGGRLLFIDTFAEEPTLEQGEWRDLPPKFWPVFDPATQVRCWCLRSQRDPDFCWKRKQA